MLSTHAIPDTARHSPISAAHCMRLIVLWLKGKGTSLLARSGSGLV